jgi:hypothetical protein
MERTNMSAYVVDDKTINRVVWATTQEPHATGRDAMTAHGRALLQMNCDAVNWRYRHNPTAMSELTACHDPEAYQYQMPDSARINKWQLLKSLQCFLYQCSEGETPQRELFQRVEQQAVALMSELLSKCSEYRDAEWA